MPNKVENAMVDQTKKFQFEVERDNLSDKVVETSLKSPQVTSPPEIAESKIENEDNENSAEIIPELDDYVLSRDRVRREIKPSTRYAHAYVIAYTLNIRDSIEYNEFVSYQEACSNKYRSNWLKAMKEEM